MKRVLISRRVKVHHHHHHHSDDQQNTIKHNNNSCHKIGFRSLDRTWACCCCCLVMRSLHASEWAALMQRNDGGALFVIYIFPLSEHQNKLESDKVLIAKMSRIHYQHHQHGNVDDPFENLEKRCVAMHVRGWWDGNNYSWVECECFARVRSDRDDENWT